MCRVGMMREDSEDGSIALTTVMVPSPFPKDGGWAVHFLYQTKYGEKAMTTTTTNKKQIKKKTTEIALSRCFQCWRPNSPVCSPNKPPNCTPPFFVCAYKPYERGRREGRKKERKREGEHTWERSRGWFSELYRKMTSMKTFGSLRIGLVS